MTRLARIGGRIATTRAAAGTMPETPDMRAFAAECIKELARLAALFQHIASGDPKRVALVQPADSNQLRRLYQDLDIKLLDRVVAGPYNRRAHIYMHFQSDAHPNGETLTPMPSLAGAVPDIPVMVRAPFFDLGNAVGDKLPRIRWGSAPSRRVVEEILQHEIIHCFDPKMRVQQLWNLSRHKSSEYLDDATEATAYEASLRGLVEAWQKAGVSRAEALDRIRVLSRKAATPGSDPLPLPGRGGASVKFDRHVMRDPSRKKDTLTRYYKIVDQVYSAPPPKARGRKKRDVAPLPPSSPLPLPG